MHNDLYQYLKTDPGISQLFDGRIYHMSLPQSVNTYPSMTFQQISRTEVSRDMSAPNTPILDQVTYQFDLIAVKSEDVIAASETFDAIFRSFRGTIGATKVQDVEMSNISQFEEREGDKLRRRISLDYQITFDV